MIHRTIVFIGMPGAGKSTIARIVAKKLGMAMVDTDRIIEYRHSRPLQELLDTLGNAGFRQIEEEALCQMNPADYSNTVIATGGSAVFSEAGMKHLKSFATLVYLKVNEKVLEKRITNFATRGIVGGEGADLLAILQERSPLYEKYADITVVSDTLSPKHTAEKVITKLQRRG